MAQYITKTGKKLKLNNSILWDIDTATLDLDIHKGWLIQRVLEYGEIDDWKSVLGFYGLKTIVESCKKMRTLDKRALSFICCLSNTNKDEYRCYHSRLSNPTLWNS